MFAIFGGLKIAREKHENSQNFLISLESFKIILRQKRLQGEVITML